MTESPETEPNPVRYVSASRQRALVVTYGLIGVLLGLLWGVLIVAFWRSLTTQRGDWSIGLGIALHIGLLFPVTALYRSCTQCTDIRAEKNGLVITTCYLLRFVVPWYNVVDMRILPRLPYPLPVDQGIEERAVSVREGLTILHCDLARGRDGNWQCQRAFSIRSDADGYWELVHTLEEHIARAKEQ